MTCERSLTFRIKLRPRFLYPSGLSEPVRELNTWSAKRRDDSMTTRGTIADSCAIWILDRTTVAGAWRWRQTGLVRADHERSDPPRQLDRVAQLEPAINAASLNGTTRRSRLLGRRRPARSCGESSVPKPDMAAETTARRPGRPSPRG